MGTTFLNVALIDGCGFLQGLSYMRILLLGRAPKIHQNTYVEVRSSLASKVSLCEQVAIFDEKVNLIRGIHK